MIWAFGTAAALFIGFMILFRTYKQERFAHLDRNAHPLKPLYPAGAKLLDIIGHMIPREREDRIRKLLRSLYVKENVEQEKYLLDVRKAASVFAAAFAAVIAGMLVCIGQTGSAEITSLQRADYGQGTVHYDLNAEYRNQEEPVGLDLEPVRYTPSEILELFEWAYEDVCRIVLGDNPSREEVTQPLNLITEYRGFDIFWEIGDISLLDYNGELHFAGKKGEQRMLDLYATFSMDGTSQIFSFPIQICATDPDENTSLAMQIQEEIARNNDISSRHVELPEKLDGDQIRFTEVKNRQIWYFLILAAAAIILIPFLYDRSLEKQNQKRQEQLMTDFTEIVSKLTLLYEAGQSIHGAFVRIVEDQETRCSGGNPKEQRKKQAVRYAYQEMRLALEKIGTGVSEGTAYAQFGKRCGLYPYIKLGNLLEQNLNKGTRGMQQILKQEVSNSFEERKRLARKKGEEAGTRILIPMVLMLMVIIVIIAVPALMSVGI